MAHTAPLVRRLIIHLQEFIDSPGASVDPKITESIGTSLCQELRLDDTRQLMGLVTIILSTEKLGADLRLILELAERIAENAPITYSDVLSIQPQIPLLDALSMTIGGSEESNTLISAMRRLALSLLQTATTGAEVGIIAAQSELVQGIVKLWLCSADTGIGQKAWQTLSQFLSIDSRLVDPLIIDSALSNASGLMWKRILGDKDIYGSLFSWTSVKTAGEEGQLSRRAKGVAQCRLMDLIKAFSHVPQLWQSQHAEIESRYVEQGEGLAQYVLARMLDKDDILEYMQLIDCCTSLLSMDSIVSSKNLEHLEFLGLHQEIISQIDSDTSFFRSSIIAYTTAYVANHPQHFLQYTSKPGEQILSHIIAVFTNTRSNQWAQPTDPTGGLLRLLASLPQIAIISNPQLKSVFLSLPLDPPNLSILSCLSHLFSGRTAITTTQLSPNDSVITTATARILFLLYLAHYPAFFSNIIAIASQLIIPATSSAAIDLIKSIAFAEWTTTDSLPPDLRPLLPSELDLASLCPVYSGSSATTTTDSLPKSGLAAVLMPPAVSHVIPFLLSSSKHLAGSETYQIAERKWEFTVLFCNKVKDMAREKDAQGESQALIQALEKRLINGFFGAGVGVSSADEEEVVHSVATLNR